MAAFSKLTKAFVTTTIGFLLCACTVTAPDITDKTNPIEAALRDGIAKDHALAAANHKKTLPSAVNKALLPDIAINTPTTSHNNTDAADQYHFDVTVTNVPAKDFFLGLTKDTKYNLTINPNLSGNISLDLKNVTIPQVMDAVRDVYGYEYERTSYGYKVFPKQLTTRIFTVNVLDINRDGKSQTFIGSGQITSNVSNSNNTTNNTATSGNTVTNPTNQNSSIGASGSIQTQTSSNFWDSLKQNLVAIIGDKDGHSVVLNQQSGTIIVHAYPDELRNVAKYLDNIQEAMQREVIIEAKILEVELSASYQSGINWKLFGSNAIKQGDPDNANNPNSPIINENMPFFNSIFTFRATDGGAFTSVIKLLSTQGRVNVLSSPHIATTNNQKAIIKVGDDRFYVTNVTSTTDNYASSGSQTSQNIVLTPFFSGISLDVTPQIDQDGIITLHIHPIVSTVTQDRQVFIVNSQNEDLPLAKSTIRESDSIVRAQNGQVIIIGGLMENQTLDFQASTPGADRLPTVGGLFKNANKRSSKVELVILLRPIVVSGNKTWEQRLNEANNFYKNLKGEFKYNLIRKKSQ
jgi:MSHA biogenesis protein MshL